MKRTAVLVDAHDRCIGRCSVAETTFVIKHAQALFVRTEKGVRLVGGGIGVVFLETEASVRDNLEPL